jgi:hypothetical protein
VFFHRGFGDAEDEGGFGVAFALGDPEQDFGFLFREAEVAEGGGVGEVGLFAGALGMAGEAGADGFQQIVEGDGFCQIVVGPADHALAEVLFFAFGGEEDEGDVAEGGIGAEGGEHAVAVHAGHHDVAKDQVGAVARGPAMPAAAVGGLVDGEAFEFERGGGELAHGFLVFDEQEFGFMAGRAAG